MIELLFAAALMDTVVAVPDEGTVYVHEWGVVTFSQQSTTVGADPEMDPYMQLVGPDSWSQTVVRAPVVYFYGEPFSGSFRVSTQDGSFIETFPQPDFKSYTNADGSSTNQAAWRIDSTEPGASADITDAHDIDVCVPGDLSALWRRPPSMNLHFSGGESERFIYYECSLPWDLSLPPVVRDSLGCRLEDSYSGEVLTFIRTENGVELQNAPDQGIVPLLCSWAGGRMKTEELQAMWSTWEGWIDDGQWKGDTLYVFPLPDSTVQSITGIMLDTDEPMNVEYSRFYLGMTAE